MKIKRIIATALFVVMLCFTLVGCEDIIGDYQYDWKPDPVIFLEYDLYIISDMGNSEEEINAQTTVNSKINQYLDDKYNTIVNIHYVASQEYAGVINSLVSGEVVSATGSLGSGNKVSSRQKAGSIILIAGEDMHNSLVEKNALVDLGPMLDTDDFGKLNTQITSSLLKAARVGDKLYLIPNDHVIGEYEYTVINRGIAEGKLNFSAQSLLNEALIVDGEANEVALELIESVQNNMSLIGVNSVEEVIKVVTGKYEDKAKWEADGYVCNISKKPIVDSSVAYTAGFGVLNTKDIFVDNNGKSELLISAAGCQKRAMDVIYAINADPTVRNMLQYGVEYTNYKFVETDNGEKYVSLYDDNVYKMNLLYTGDMFNAYCSKDLVWSIDGTYYAWTEEMMVNGELQNKDAVNK